MASEVKISVASYRLLIRESPQMARLLHRKATEINRRAKLVFISRQIPTNEGDTSQTTPPKYLNRFSVEKIERARGVVYRSKNTDPAAKWVEYGAHAGGETKVLEYAPFRTALTEMMVE